VAHPANNPITAISIKLVFIVSFLSQSILLIKME
jgi:hypothetical protein